MPVISLASSKGGAGKTTACIVLGTIISETASVTIIDADPAQRLVRWSKKRELPKSITIIADTNEDTIMDTIAEAQSRSDIVMIDLEGVFSRLNTFALLRSDLVIVPMAKEQQDADDAVLTLAQIKRDGMSARREIPARILFSRTKAAVPSNLEKEIHAAMSANVPCLENELIGRTAYSNLHSRGGTLRDLKKDGEVRGVDKAIDNAMAVAKEVYQILEDGLRHAAE